MKEKIVALAMHLYPVLAEITDSKGISSSEAQRRAEDNKNKNEKFLTRFNTSRPLYNSTRIVHSFGVMKGTTNIEQKLEKDEILDLEDFGGLLGVGKLYGESARYKVAIKLLDNFRQDVQCGAKDTEIATYLDLGESKPAPYYTFQPGKSPINTDINTFTSRDRIEDLFINISCPDLMSKVGNLLEKALNHEAIASVLGKQLHSSSLIKKMMKARPKITSNVTEGIKGHQYYDVQTLVYKSEDIENIYQWLEGEYTKHQKKRNSYIKQIKDAARTAVIEFDKAEKIRHQEESDAHRLEMLAVQKHNFERMKAIGEARGMLSQYISKMMIKE